MEKYVRQLDGIRAVAVGLVLITHLWTYPSAFPKLNLLAAAGWIGVDLFFVLSGFLITGILRGAREDPSYYRNFYARRALRIFPLYFLLLTLVFLVRPLFSDHAKVADEWMYWLYLGNFALAAGGWQLFLIDITWSLSLEEQFYLLWPMAIRQVSDKQLEILCVAVIVAMPLLRIILWEGLGWMWLHVLFRADGFAFGALVALLYRRRSRLLEKAAPMFVISSLMLLWLVIGGRFARDAMLTGTIGYSLTSLVAATSVILAIRSKVLALSPIVHVGKVSYGVYLLHPLCSVAISFLLTPSSGLLGGVQQIVVISSITVLLATASYRVYESPFLRLKTHFPSAQGDPKAAVQSYYRTRSK